jgi:hypothetical protein
MFEPWERFDARKAAALMNKHRRIVRQEHARVRKLLRQKPKDQKATNISEQVNALRQTWRNALTDQIGVCTALTRDFFTINVATLVNAFLAQSRFFATSNEVARTLQTLSQTSNDSKSS